MKIHKISVIEVATFDGPSLRETARRLNLLTDASQHYIKGALNTANSLNILERCANLLEELADAKEIYETVSTTLYIEDKYVSVSTHKLMDYLEQAFKQMKLRKSLIH